MAIPALLMQTTLYRSGDMLLRRIERLTMEALSVRFDAAAPARGGQHHRGETMMVHWVVAGGWVSYALVGIGVLLWTSVFFGPSLCARHPPSAWMRQLGGAVAAIFDTGSPRGKRLQRLGADASTFATMRALSVS